MATIPTPRRLTWLTALAAALLLGGATGIAVATERSATPGPATTVSPAPDDKAKERKARGKLGNVRGPVKAKQLLRGKAGGRVLHGEYVLAAADGKFQTVVAQTGLVTAVSPSSITVKSADGFTATYAIKVETRIKGARGGGIASVVIGSRAEVLALEEGAALIAQTLHARPPKSAGPPD